MGAILVAHGEGSRAVRRGLFAQEHPSVEFTTGTGNETVRLVPSYTHLGCVLQADGSDLPALQFRAQQAFAAYGPVRKRLLSNPYLTEQEKLLILRSRVLSTFMHGAGLLVMRTAKEKEKYEDTLYKLFRGAFRPVLGVSCQGFSNCEVAAALGLALPGEMLTVARARALADLVRAQLRPVLQVFQAEGTWWTAACKAARDVGLMCAPDESLEAVLKAMDRSPREVSLLCRRFFAKQCASRPFSRAELQPREAPDAAILVAARGPELPAVCHLCGVAFGGPRQLAVHLSKHHQHRPAHVTAAFGTACQCCLMEFWSQDWPIVPAPEAPS